MCRILRLPLNADLPMVCMTCERPAAGRVARIFRANGRSHQMQVPACGFCSTVLRNYLRYQLLATLLLVAAFVGAVVLFCLDVYFCAQLALLSMLPPGLHFLYYHWRFERDCLALGPNFAVVKVHSKAFADARDASLQQEDFSDWYERLRCEGESLRQIAARLESFGFPSRDGYETVVDAERSRKSIYRLHGLRRFMKGSVWTVLTLAAFQLWLPLIFLWTLGLRPMLGGMRQMLMGTGYSV